MSVKIAYTEIRDLLLAVPELETVRLFNNQVEKDIEEDAFEYPAVFIEFLPIEWVSKRSKIQTGEAEIVFHIAITTLETEDINFLDIVQIVHGVLEGYLSPTSNVVSNPMKRTVGEQDTDHDATLIWKDTYTTKINDFSNCPETDFQEIAPGTVSANLTFDIDIDDINLRTGDADFVVPDYDPLTDDELVMYYDYSGLVVGADNSFGTVDGAGLVSKWKNLKGVSSFDQVQTITTEQPTLSANFITFDSINDFMSSADIPAEIKSLNDFTFIIVAESISSASNTNLIAFQGAANNFILHQINIFAQTSLISKDSAAAADFLLETTAISSGTTFINRMNFKTAWEIFSNGNSTLSGMLTNTKAPTLTSLMLGKSVGGSVNIRECKLKAVMVWKNEQTDAQKLLDINTFLLNKFP